MIGFLRVYLYWTILWGFLVHPALGLRSAAPSLLLGMDALMMLLTSTYVLGGLGQLRDKGNRRLVTSTLTCIAVMAGYGLTITAISGGSVVEAAKYLGVLIRPALLLLALFVLVKQPRSQRLGPSLRRTLNLDLTLLVTAQLLVATLQLLSPDMGADFIPALSEAQSAIAALADGDVSGTFANSIDLAYFLVAAYLAMTSEHWRLRRRPPLMLTMLLGYFTYATGSATAAVCFALYAAYLYLRLLARPTRQRLYAITFTCIGCVVYLLADEVGELVLSKVENMMLSRLGLIFISLPTIAQVDPVRLLTGLGADFTVIESMLKGLPDVPLVFTYDDVSSVINDVFWVALTLALGAPIVIYYLVRLTALFQAYMSNTEADIKVLPLLRMLVLMILLAGLLNQILAVRSFVSALLIGLLPLALKGLPRRHPAAQTQQLLLRQQRPASPQSV